MATQEINTVIFAMIENVHHVPSILMTLVMYVEFQVTQLAYLVVHQVHVTVMTGMDEYGIMSPTVPHTIVVIVVDYAGAGIQGIVLLVKELVTMISEKTTQNATNVYQVHMKQIS